MATEANAICRLKCLILKEFFYLDQPRFLLGNFEHFLRDTQTRFDLAVASGVLYHLMDPLLSLLEMTCVTGHIFVWSHFLMMLSCRSMMRVESFSLTKQSSASKTDLISPITSLVRRHFALSQAYATVQSCTTSAGFMIAQRGVLAILKRPWHVFGNRAI